MIMNQHPKSYILCLLENSKHNFWQSKPDQDFFYSEDCEEVRRWLATYFFEQGSLCTFSRNGVIVFLITKEDIDALRLELYK